MSEKRTATLIENYGRSRGTAGDQRLYRLDPPMTVSKTVDAYELRDFITAALENADENDRIDAGLIRAAMTTEEQIPLVLVSASDVPYSGPETYIFAADKSGEVTDWAELNGSYRGGMDHEEALRNAGYEVAS